MSPTTTDTASLDAEQYLQAVTPHLAGLPADERADLLDDLAQHLREIAAEPGPPLAERLGPPAAYAAELLASAGVTAEVPPAAGFAARSRALADRARRSWTGREVVRLWPVLRPAWWVARAWLAVSLVASGNQHGPGRFDLLPRLHGSPLLGLLALLVAISVSVRLGQRSLSGAGRFAVGVADVVLVVYALTLLGRPGAVGEVRVVDKQAVVAPDKIGGRACLVDGSGNAITNLYAYDADGHLLDPVLLYDQDGQPVDNVCPALGRRAVSDYPVDQNGAPVLNAYPQHESTIGSPLGGIRLPPGKPGAPAEPVEPVKPPAVVVPRLAPPTTVPTK